MLQGQQQQGPRMSIHTSPGSVQNSPYPSPGGNAGMQNAPGFAGSFPPGTGHFPGASPGGTPVAGEFGRPPHGGSSGGGGNANSVPYSNLPQSAGRQGNNNAAAVTSSSPTQGHPPPPPQQSSVRGNPANAPPFPGQPSGTPGAEMLPKDLQNIQPTSMSDQEITALLSRQDIATSLAEDLLAQFAQGHHHDNKDSSSSAGQAATSQGRAVATVPGQQQQQSLGPLNVDPFAGIEKPAPFSPTASNTYPHSQADSDPTLSVSGDSGLLGGSLHSKQNIDRKPHVTGGGRMPANHPASDLFKGVHQHRNLSTEGAESSADNDLKSMFKMKTLSLPVSKASEPQMNIHMTAQEIITACQGLGELRFIRFI